MGDVKASPWASVPIWAHLDTAVFPAGDTEMLRRVAANSHMYLFNTTRPQYDGFVAYMKIR